METKGGKTKQIDNHNKRYEGSLIFIALTREWKGMIEYPLFHALQNAVKLKRLKRLPQILELFSFVRKQKTFH